MLPYAERQPHVCVEMKLPCAGDGRDCPAPTPLQILKAIRLRGERQGAAAPPAPPPRDFVPWIPDSMLPYAERQARMPAGNPKRRQLNIELSI